MLELESQLKQRATSLRNYLQSNAPGSHLPLLQDFPTGGCKIASIFFLKLMKDIDGLATGFLVANAQRREATHAWVEVEGFIVDIAADQFDDFWDPVFVGLSSPWHDSWRSATQFSYPKYGHLTGPHESEYQACLAWTQSPS